MSTARLLIRDLHGVLAIALIIFVLTRDGDVVGGRNLIGREADAERLGLDASAGNDQLIRAGGDTLGERKVHGLRTFFADIGVRPVRGRRVEDGPVAGGQEDNRVVLVGLHVITVAGAGGSTVQLAADYGKRARFGGIENHVIHPGPQGTGGGAIGGEYPHCRAFHIPIEDLPSRQDEEPRLEGRGGVEMGVEGRRQLRDDI